MTINYSRYRRFIKSVMLDAGYSKSNGEPNIDAFYKAHEYIVKEKNLTLSKSSFQSQVQGPKADPYGTTINALAIVLSHASGKKVTPAILNDLIDREALEEFTDPIEEDLIPGDEVTEQFKALEMLDSIASLSLESRSLIAPKLLALLADDWALLDAPEVIKVARLLHMELKRKAMGVDRFSAKVLGGMIPAESLAEIRDCKIPSKSLTIKQVVKLAENLYMSNGDAVTIQDLQCLVPHLSLDRL